jgi:L-iditol 2-dehydrogenase
MRVRPKTTYNEATTSANVGPKLGALMWAYVLSGPGQLTRIDAALPDITKLSDTDVVVRTLAGGVCGSDIARYLRQGQPSNAEGRGPIGYPMHEIVGEVVASRRVDLPVGCRVVGWASKTNGLAEYVSSGGDQLAEYDSSFAPGDAVAIQTVACVLYAAEQLRPAGRSVAIIGLGPIGLLFAHVLKNLGAEHVTGIDPVDRSTVADVFGLDEAVCLSSDLWSAGLTERNRSAITVEAVGHQTATLGHALAATRIGGTVLYFGIPDEEYYPLHMERLMRRNLTLIGGVTRDRHRKLVEAGEYLRKHRDIIHSYITHRYRRDEAQQAYQTAAQTNSRIKVVISLE